MLVGVALAAFPLAGAGEAAPALVPLAAVSLALLALTVLWLRVLGLLLAALAAEFVVATLHSSLAAGAVVVCGAGLLLLGELLALADTLRSTALVEPAVLGARLGHLAAIVLVGAGASALTLAGSGLSAPNAFLGGVGGAAAVAALLGLVWALGREG